MIKNLNAIIAASVAMHFTSKIEGLTTYVEGDPHRPNDKDHVEIRYDGPITEQVSALESKVDFEVNLLVTTAIQSENGDLYAHSRNVDKAIPAFVDIPIFRDNDVIGCAELKQNSRSRDYIEVRQFGQIEPSILIEQATIEGHYTVYLEG